MFLIPDLVSGCEQLLLQVGAVGGVAIIHDARPAQESTIHQSTAQSKYWTVNQGRQKGLGG